MVGDTAKDALIAFNKVYVLTEQLGLSLERVRMPVHVHGAALLEAGSWPFVKFSSFSFQSARVPACPT